jgi:hypothetical protein
MSRKQFIALADTIRANRELFSDEAIEKLAEFCRSQNSGFKRDRWISYINGNCGPYGGAVHEE